MNNNTTDNMSKKPITNRSLLNTTQKKINPTPISKNTSPYTPTQSSPNNPKSNIKSSIPQSVTASNSSPRVVIKTTPPPPRTISTALRTDNTQASTTIANHSDYDASTISHTQIAHTTRPTLSNTNNNINFASAAAMEKTPSREQAIVFNSIDGIPQKEYILAIGKIVLPKNITFVSRISNNRFCIFLSSKQILDNLIQTTQVININDQIIQIRRLINPAKRFIISNVCPSIPNLTIEDALRNIGITPISKINHLKAGINVEGYEHILSFRRQMFLNHDDIPKLPSSLLIYSNENQFRIFFTDDKITCFLCKSVGHTTSNCKTNTENKLENDDPIIINETNTHDHTTTEQIVEVLPPTTPNEKLQLEQSTMDWSKEIELPSQSQSTFDETLNFPPIETYKRPLSDSSSLKTPVSPSILTSPTTTPIKGKITKKIKVRSRSNSVNRQEKNPEEELKPVVEFFTANESLPITFLQFKHILNNFTNKSLNIHSLTEDVKIDIPSLMNLLDQIRIIAKDRSLKARLTKLANLLFQALPPQ